MADAPPPGDLPRSPSGRVPQWVLDEANGRPAQDTTWRAEPTPGSSWQAERDSWTRARRRPARRRVAIAAVAVTVLALLGALQFANGGADGLLRLSQQEASTYGPPVGVDETSRPVGLPVGGTVEATGGMFRFLEHQADGTTPVTWSPCRPIHFVVRPDHAAPGALSLLRSQFDVISRETGLRFVYDGATRELPSRERLIYQPTAYGDRFAPVLITWSTRQEMPEGSSDALGVAMPMNVTAGGGDRVFVSGVIQFDADWVAAALAARTPAEVRATMLHELGHLVGLEHVTSRRALMYPEVVTGVTPTTFAPGELPGLTALGRGPCRPDL